MADLLMIIIISYQHCRGPDGMIVMPV